jgi:hypothetical protein
MRSARAFEPVSRKEAFRGDMHPTANRVSDKSMCWKRRHARIYLGVLCRFHRKLDDSKLTETQEDIFCIRTYQYERRLGHA